LGIKNIIDNTLNARWTWTDDFSFAFHNNAVFFPSTGFNPQDVWDMAVINVDTPQVSASVSSVVMGQSYRFFVPLHETFSITVTFRDFEHLKLKEYFTKIWAKQQTYYYDEIKSYMKVVAGEGRVFESYDLLINSVSQSQLDNANTQILEFSVEFISSKITNNTLFDFGGWRAY